jgi:hypothetical protein
VITPTDTLQKVGAQAVRPTLWLLLVGQIAVALAALYSGDVGPSVVAYAFVFSSFGALAGSIWPTSSVSWLALGFAPMLVVLLVPYAAGALWIEGMWGALRRDVLVDLVRVATAALAFGVSALVARRAGARPPPQSKPDLAEEKKEAQRLKLELVRANLLNQEVTERLRAMISYAVGRVDYYENLRHRHMTIGLALFTGGAALAGFVLKGATEIPPLAALCFGVGAVELFGAGLWITHFYNRTSSPSYAYRGIADIRSWYFVYNLPAGTTDDLAAMELSVNEETARQQAKNVTNNVKRFIERWIEEANDRAGFIAEDLEQVFILQFIQAYKQKAVTKMQRALYRFLVAFAVTLVLGIVIWIGNFGWHL